jgi:hypothetical protein
MLSTEGGVMAKKPIILSSEISPAPALVRAGMNVLGVCPKNSHLMLEE